MIVYLDASALVKRYVNEAGSDAVEALITGARALGTGVISRAEVAAALARAARMKIIGRDAAVKALAAFDADWEHLIRLQFGELSHHGHRAYSPHPGGLLLRQLRLRTVSFLPFRLSLHPSCPLIMSYAHCFPPFSPL